MLEMLLAMLEALGEDAYYSVHGAEVTVTLHDFEGFDDDWEEIMRDYDDEEAVEAFEAWLEEACESSEGDYYRYYHFDGFDVCLGYSSMDI